MVALLRQARKALAIAPLFAARSFATAAPLSPIAIGDVSAYIGGPKGAPAVIVIQEWWGVTDGIKDKASKIADEGGYRVLVPDIYKGKVGVDAEEASHLSSHTRSNACACSGRGRS